MTEIDSRHASDPASQAMPGVASAVPETTLHLRVDRLVQDAALALARGDSVAAIRLSADALASAVDSEEPALMAQARVISARVAWATGATEQALADLELAWPTAQTQTDEPLKFHCLNMLGIVCGDLGQFNRSMEWHAAACAVARDAGLSDLEAVAAANGAGRWLDIGDRADAAADAAAAEAAWTMAVQSANAAAPLAERAGAHRASLILAANRSAALARLGRFEAAEAGFAEALRLSHFAVDGTVALRIAENRVRMLLKQREVEAAHQLVTLSLAQGESVGAKAPLADLHDRAAEVCEALGDLPAAMQHLRRGAQLRSDVATRRRIAIDLHTTQTERIHAGRLSALGQVSAEMVHEMNQPLGALRMLLDNACAMLGDDRVGDALSNLHRVAQLVDRLGRLTRQINLFTHKTPVRTAAVPLRQAIDLSLMALAHRQQDLSVQVDVLVSPPDLAVRADEARLEQVLVNLLGNAFDAVSGKPARRVHILGSQVGDRCLVSIADSGPGIRLDMLSALFEPFATSKQAGAGLGLGLTIARHIVGEFGGSLRGNNRPAGGAEFTIDLPLAERHLGGPS